MVINKIYIIIQSKFLHFKKKYSRKKNHEKFWKKEFFPPPAWDIFWDIFLGYFFLLKKNSGGKYPKNKLE